MVDISIFAPYGWISDDKQIITQLASNITWDWSRTPAAGPSPLGPAAQKSNRVEIDEFHDE